MHVRHWMMIGMVAVAAMGAPLSSLALSLDALLPSLSTTGVFTKSSFDKFLNVYKTVGETVEIDLTEGKLWTNEFVTK